MSRYIDVDALKEYIGGVRAEFNFFDDDERARYEAHSKAIYLLDLYVSDAPSIDIVRCKECKYAHMTYGGDCKYCDMWKDDDDFCIELYLDGDFYCSYGERNDNEF